MAVGRTIELVNEYSKVKGYKIDIHMSIVFVYSSNEHSKNKINQIVSFKIASIGRPYLGLKLTKEVQDI